MIKRIFYEHFIPADIHNGGFKNHFDCSLKQLTLNHRSMKGVLDLAAAQVELMYRWFPSKVDYLKRETALAKDKRLPKVIWGKFMNF